MTAFTDPDISLITNIFDLMCSDYENPRKQSQILMSTYASASPKSKEAIDNCFIALCGYSLKSVMEDMESVHHA